MARVKAQNQEQYSATMCVLADDTDHLVNHVSRRLTEFGCNVKCLNAATPDGIFSLNVSFTGTARQIRSLKRAIPRLARELDAGIIIRRSPKPIVHLGIVAATHDLFVTAFDAEGIVSEVTEVVSEYGGILNIAGNKYPPPNQGIQLFVIVAHIVVQPGKEKALAQELEELRDKRKWADAEIYPHGRHDTSALVGAPPFPPSKTWQTYEMPEDLANSERVHEISMGNVRAIIWERALDDGKCARGVTLERRSKNESDWQSLEAFACDELPVAAHVASEAFKWILRNRVRHAA